MKNDAVVAASLSGGVDSSVAASILKERFSRIVGATHYIWPDSKCCNVTVLNRAEALCRRFGFPYYVIDLQEEFSRSVVDDFAESYVKGNTPNPCVRCNERLRFDVFYRRVREKLIDESLLDPEEGMYFATGHYARIEQAGSGWHLKKGRDERKDQSYMLYRLSSDVLPNILFPLGELTKDEVQKRAQAEGLPSALVKESQDACFVEGEYARFLQEYLGRQDLRKPGSIKDLSGNVLGMHTGYIGYTRGQRKGLNLGNGPWYVADLDPEHNVVVVGRKEEIGTAAFSIKECKWLVTGLPDTFGGSVKIRYNSPETPCRVEKTGETAARITLGRQSVITPGQSAVLYEGDLVLGGGIICSA